MKGMPSGRPESKAVGVEGQAAATMDTSNVIETEMTFQAASSSEPRVTKAEMSEAIEARAQKLQEMVTDQRTVFVGQLYDLGNAVMQIQDVVTAVKTEVQKVSAQTSQPKKDKVTEVV